jgi:uncharacterized protein (TIGR02302 family)
MMSKTRFTLPIASRRLSLVVRLTRWGMVLERGVQAFWPLWVVLCLAVGAVLLGLFEALGPALRWGFVGFATVLTLGFGWRGARRFHWPSLAQASVRLDHSLPGRPLQALWDHPGIGHDHSGQALWAAHMQRMEQRLNTARPVAPDLAQAKSDPFALRYMALLFLVVALLFGSVTRLQSVTNLGGGVDLAQGPAWEGWVTPPAYTGLPVLYLNDINGTLNAPKGAQVKLRLYGEPGVLSVSESVSNQPRTTDQPSHDFTIAQSGQITVDGNGGRIWQVAMLPDRAPSIEVGDDLQVTYEGEARLSFTARDDHAVTGGTVRVTLDLAQVDRRYGRSLPPEPRADISVPLPVPVVGDLSEFTQPFVANFSQHPWAHLPVSLHFEVRDGQGQIGQAAPVAMNLPARRCFDPLAAAVIEVRQAILWNRAYARDAALIMRALANDPEGLFHKDDQQGRYRTILTSLEQAPLSDETRDQLAEDLWALAIDLEEIDLESARKRLERARQKLEEAMKNGASKDQIERLMQELREATDDYMRQLSREQAQGQQPQPQGDGDSMSMSMDDLQAMRDRIQELMEQGRMAEAAEALEQYNEMLENMQVTQGGSGSGGGQNPSDQAMEDLSETLRDQQDLSDQAFRDLQDQFTNPEQGQRQEQPGESQGSLADQQRALRDQVNRQRQTLPGQSTEGGQRAGEALGEADEAMRQAERALRDGDLAEALDQQSRAMEALRDGIRGLGDAQREAQQGQSGQQQQGQANQGGQQQGSDPLGRSTGQGGRSDSQDGIASDLHRRADDLLNELRRRSGEQDRPEQERRYLERLLDRF